MGISIDRFTLCWEIIRNNGWGRPLAIIKEIRLCKPDCRCANTVQTIAPLANIEHHDLPWRCSFQPVCCDSWLFQIRVLDRHQLPLKWWSISEENWEYGWRNQEQIGRLRKNSAPVPVPVFKWKHCSMKTLSPQICPLPPDRFSKKCFISPLS